MPLQKSPHVEDCRAIDVGLVQWVFVLATMQVGSSVFMSTSLALRSIETRIRYGLLDAIFHYGLVDV